MLRAFLRDGALYTLPALVSRGLALFLLPLYTRVLSPGDYGSLELITVLASIVNLTIALEVSQGIARFYADEPDPARKTAYASSALWFTAACYTVFLIAAMSMGGELSTFVLGQPGQLTAFRVALLFIWTNGIFYLIQNQLRWELRAGGFAIVSITMTVVTAVTAIILAYGLQWGLVGILAAQCAGCLSGALVGLWILRRTYRLQFDYLRLREMLRFSWPLVPSGVAVWASTYIDRLMINHFLDIDEVGLYGIGFRLASIAALAMAGFQGALTPLVYTHYRKASTPAELARIFRLFVVISLLMFLGISLFAADLLRLLTTEAFYGAAVVVPYLVPAVLLAQMYIFAPGISIAKKTHLILWINVFGALLNALLNLYFIPRYGIAGAAVAMLLGYGVVFALYLRFSQKFYPVPHHWLRISMTVLAAVVLLLAALRFGGSGATYWTTRVIALLIFPLAAIALGMVTREELRGAAALLRRA
jgi:O-antigen/teichoic acid export membrane protein